MKRALFVGYGGGHVSMLLPVLARLREIGAPLQPTLLALTTGYNPARAAGEDAKGYGDFLQLVDRDAALAWGERLLPGNESPDVSREESVAYLGINYLDLIAQHGEEGAARVYAERGRYGFLPLHFMRRVMDEVRPDVVVATNSPRSEEAALRVAAERGVPSVGMVDLFGLETDHLVRREPRPSHTCVLAESVRQRLLPRGFAADRVHATGNPAFDGLFSPQTLDAGEAFLKRKGWQGSKVILYLGARETVGDAAGGISEGRSFPAKVEALLRAYVAARADTALVVRYHPSDWFLYPRTSDDARHHFSVPPEEPIHPLVQACTVAVTANSTVGLQAAIAGKQVVTLEDSPTVRQTFSLARLGVSVGCERHVELPDVLDRVLEAGASSTAFSSDGRAAERVAKVVLKAVGLPE